MKPELTVKCHRCGHILYEGGLDDYHPGDLPALCPNCGRPLPMKPATVRIVARETGESVELSLREYIMEGIRRRFMRAEEKV